MSVEEGMDQDRVDYSSSSGSVNMLDGMQEISENGSRRRPLPISSSPGLDHAGNQNDLTTPPQSNRNDLMETENGGSVNLSTDILIASTPPTSVLNDEERTEDEDDSSDDEEWTEFMYKAENVSEKLARRFKDQSPVFRTSNGWPWRIGVHFEGFGTGKPHFISCYLEMADVEEKRSNDSSLPSERRAQFKLDVLTRDGVQVSKLLPKNTSSVKDPRHHRCGALAENRFHVLSSPDYGYEQLISKELFNELCITNADEAIFMVRVRPVPDASLDSKSSTGMVGLLNQGATCYLNSLLQTLYHTRLLRKTVYEIDTSSDKAEQGVALELQHLFADLQTKPSAVGTQNLTKAFGWADAQVFTQHDVQELLRELLDKLSERLKGTPHENIIKNLFCGQYATYVKCINVNCETYRSEDFFDLQLDVRGSESVMESFRKYVQEERLDGENQYDAEGFGKQDAMKGVKFLYFPPVLHLHLKRFAYNFYEDRSFKIHDRFEFPEKLDLNEFVRDRPPERANENFTYRLHSVLVHSGNDQRGHYYAFVYLEDPTSQVKKARWFRFNDEWVSKVKRKVAVEHTFGVGAVVRGSEEATGGSAPLVRTWSDPKRLKMTSGISGVDSHASAYMLVYIREDMWEEVMCPVESVPQELMDRFQRDVHNKELERERNEREKHRGLMRVATMANVLSFDQYKPVKTKDVDDWVEWDRLPEIEYGDRRWATNNDLYKACEREFPQLAVPGKFRLWNTCSRRNNTLRMEEILQPTEERIKQNDFNSKLFIEVDEGGIKPKRPKEISLLFREYDPSIPGIRPNSGAFVPNTGLLLEDSTTSDLWEVLATQVLKGRISAEEATEEYDLFELMSLSFSEKRHTQQIPYSVTTVLSEDDGPGRMNLEPAGDIILYSRKPKSNQKSCVEYFHMTCRTFPVYCHNINQLDASPNDSEGDVLAVTVQAEDIMESKVVSAIASMHNVLPDRIRLTQADPAHPERPERQPVADTDYRLTCHAFFQRKFNKKGLPTQTIVFYEVLPFPREEMERYQLFRLVVHYPPTDTAKKTPVTPLSNTIVRCDRPVPVRFVLRKEAKETCAAIFEEVVKRAPVVDSDQTELVLYVVGGGRLERVLNHHSPVDDQVVRGSPHGVPLLTVDGDFALLPEASREPRLFGEIVMLPPPEVQARRLRIAVLHCTLKDELSFPNEFGVPSLMYIWEGDTLGSFWKRLLSRLGVSQEISSSWRPLIGVNETERSAAVYMAPKLSFLDVRGAGSSVSGENGVTNGSALHAPVPMHPVPSALSIGTPLAATARPGKRPRVSQEEYDSLPLWARPEVERALTRPPPSNSGGNLPAVFIYIRHSFASPGRTGTPVNSLTIRST